MKNLRIHSVIPFILFLGIAVMVSGCDPINFIDPHGGGNGGGDDTPRATTSALDFDGSDDYVRVKNSRALQLSGLEGFTIDAWVRSESWGSWNWVLTHARSNANNDVLFGFDRGRVRFITNNLANDLTGRTRLETDRWYHVAGVLDRSDGTMRIFVNGRLEAQMQMTRGSEITTADIFIGARESFGTDRPVEFFDGLLHNVRIYNMALSAEDIRRVMKDRDHDREDEDGDKYRGISPISNLIAHWPMDEGHGTTARDHSGNDHHGHIFGATWVTALDPTR